MTDFDDIEMLGFDTDKYPKPKRRRVERREHGRLHSLLKEGLPDFVEDDLFDVRSLARKVGVSFQAMYKWFDNELIPAKRIEMMIYLSENTRKRPRPKLVDGKKVSWSPLRREDFWEFLSR